MAVKALEAIDWQLWVAPLMLIGGGLLIGVILERLFISAMRQIFSRASLELNGTLVRALKGIILGLFLITGLHLATYTMPDVSPQSMAIVRKLLFILGMLVAVRLVSKVAVILVRFYLTRSEQLQSLPNTSIFENVIKIVVYLLGILMLLQTVGVSVMPIITALGVGGLAISLALQDTLANMIAGINMILARQIKIGDFIKLHEGGYDGTVEDIGWRTTIIRQPSGNLVIVPNSKIASNIITNNSLPVLESPLTVELSVAYGSDLAHVEELCREVARETLKNTVQTIREFEPLIRFHTMGDAGIHFNVTLRGKNMSDQGLVKHEFLKRLYLRFGEEGIEIPYPHRVLHLEGIDLEGGSLDPNRVSSNN